MVLKPEGWYYVFIGPHNDRKLNLSEWICCVSRLHWGSDFTRVFTSTGLNFTMGTKIATSSCLNAAY